MEINELLVHLKNNELQYFDEFYEQTKKNVFYMAYSILQNFSLSEDILQDTYLKFLQHVKRLNTHQSVVSYLMTIARNLSLNLLKKRKREEIIDAEAFDVEEEQHKDEYDFELLHQIKGILNPDEFQMVVLHVLNDLPHKEVARIMKKPLGTVTWAYNNAIAKLKRRIEDEHRTKD